MTIRGRKIRLFVTHRTVGKTLRSPHDARGYRKQRGVASNYSIVYDQ